MPIPTLPALALTGALLVGALAAPAAAITPGSVEGGGSSPSAFGGETRQAREANAAIAKLAASAEDAAKKLAKDSWTNPVDGAYRLTARFGQCSGLWSHCHTGLDMAAPSGTPLKAVAGGTITETGWAGAYGNRTVLTLKDGTEIWYCHQSAIGAKPGQTVFSGQEIGLIGATGNVTGPHLHLEVRPGAGDPVDPYRALVFHGVQP